MERKWIAAIGALAAVVMMVVAVAGIHPGQDAPGVGGQPPASEISDGEINNLSQEISALDSMDKDIPDLPELDMNIFP